LYGTFLDIDNPDHQQTSIWRLDVLCGDLYWVLL
jgi:hypothetical protein